MLGCGKAVNAWRHVPAARQLEHIKGINAMNAKTIRRLKPGLSIGLHLLAALFWAGVATAGPVPATTFSVVNNNTTSWVIDGVNNPPLTLIRGQTYNFALQNTPSVHPFNINTINTTGAASQYNNGVTNNGGTGTTIIQFVVPMGAPDSLHYNCGNHAAMNGPITIIDDGIFASGFDPAPVP